MDGIYEVSSSEKVRSLEEDLRKELKELQHEVEEGNFLGLGSQKTFGSVPLPKDVDHFRRERKLAISKALQVREAKPLVIQADVMQEEMEGALKYEYTAKSIPLLLHQFYIDRIEQLVQCKHMHMLRWARFCEHTRAIENLYSSYQKRLSHIMEEYHDTLQRARRLAVATEAALAGSASAMHSVTVEDLMIFTRWLVCYMHSVKRIHTFLRVLEWLPTMHKDSVKPQVMEKEEKSSAVEAKPPQASTKAKVNLKRVLSQVSLMAHLQVLRPQQTPAENLPPPPPLSLSPYQLVSAKSPSVAAAAAASGGGLASDEINLGLPLHETAREKFKPVLEFLMNCYAVDMEINQLNTHADEMELFTMVSRRFKKVFFKQEQLRTFPTYDASIEELGDSNIRSKGVLHTFKQQSNWLKFVQLRAEQDADQVKTMTKLKHKNNIDELLKAHSKFLHVQDGQRVMNALRDHAKAVMEPPKPHPVSVTTHRTSNDTAAVWKRIFSYASSRDDVLEFETKLTDEDMGVSGSGGGEFELGTAVELLGLDDEEAKTQASILQGAYMAYLLLRHLRLRDLQRSCLSILNYFRSVERTLTINDGGLSLEGGKQKSNRQQVFHGGGVIGVGSHQYIHNTPADYKLEQSEFMEFSEVENHDDFFTMEEGRVHVQDQRGYYVMYVSGLADFKKLEHELLLITTHYIQKDKDLRLPRGLKFRGDQLDIASYGHQQVDRFGVLLDLWTNEAAYLENKRQLLDCYLEAYSHVFDPKEKRELAQVITNIMHQRPRFDLSANYFVKTYRAECVCLRLHCNLIKSILDQQIDQERKYNQKVNREDSSVRFGLPHRVIAQQHIAVNTSRPALKYIYMLEFHPSLALASRILQSLKHAFKVFMEVHKPKTTTEVISMEKRLYEVAQKEWDNMEPSGHQFAPQVQKDLFSEVFVEDPLFVCEVGQSLISAEESKKGGRKSQKEKQKMLTDTWSKLLEVITLRHRLIMASQETEVLTKAYKIRAKGIGFEEYHVYLRSVSFDYAQSKPEADLHPTLVNVIQEDDSRIDRYTPAHVPLAIQELDEKHVGSFSFRTRESFLQVMSGMGTEKLQTVLMSQIVHKNLIIAALQQLDGCAKIVYAAKEKPDEHAKRLNIDPSQASSLILDSLSWRQPTELPSPAVRVGYQAPESLCSLTSGGLTPVSSSHGTSFGSRPSSAETERTHLTAFTTKRVDREFERKLQEAFVSVQLEKTFWRDKMLNDYLVKKSQLGTVLKNIEEVIKLKRKLLTDFCSNLHKKVAQYSLQAQIIAYTISLLNLMGDFPSTRNAHFMIGKEDEKKAEDDDAMSPDPKQFKSRPRRFLSPDGKKLLNLWFVPHYSEILAMFGKLKLDTRNAALHVTLRLVSSLHDICQYLCAHARLGSSHARLGSQKLEFSGVTADWGGTEGIGAELREIQRQINHLENPQDPNEVADFLARRRDNMFLEFDISISHSVRDTFLSTGNESAHRSITDNMHFALQNLSSLSRTNIYSIFLPIPEPLDPRNPLTQQLYPWRSFFARHGPYPMQYWLWDEIGSNLQLCLAGLRSVDRHVVNGEILGVSLLLEDVLQHGLPDMFFTSQADDATSVASATPRSRPATSTSRKTTSSSVDDEDALDSSEVDIPKGPLSFNTNPKAAVKLINKFLLICSRLELLKTDYGCRKLGVNVVSTTKLYKAFCKIYKIDILQPVYQQVAVKHGQGQEYAALGALVSDDEPLSTPPGATEMELKVKQVIRLLENLECTMIYDVIRRISREHTLVVSERGRDDATLPTDLWKKPVMKENCTISKPHLVENFVQDLMTLDQMEQEENLVITKDHLNKCLLKLASETMLRERNAYDSYAMYYENLLRNQHQLLYIKEQEIKQLKDVIDANKTATIVDVHCQLADRSHEQLLEITALRAKLAEMRETIMNQEIDLRERIKNDFAKLVQELFTNCFMMRTRFEEFRLTLYDDVHEGLSDVRRHAVEDMKKMREKSGTFKEEAEAESSLLLTKSEQIRTYQEENKNLGQLFLKMKTMHNWKRTRLYDRYHDSVDSLREEADRAKRECLEVKKMAEERDILLKQEQAALRKALAEVERECQKLRKKLHYEQKAKMQKTHAQLQEAYSLRQLELAKSNNIDKLIADLEEKEQRLRLLTENLDRDQKKNWFAQEQSKKTMKHMMQQLEHERHLKLDAFERVEELQMQIYDYEQHITDILSRPPSTAGFRTDKRPVSSFAAPTVSPVPHPLPRAMTVMAGRNASKQTNSKPSGGGLWPPPVSFPGRLSVSPDPAASGAGSSPSKIQRPKTHSGRLRSKITESLVGDPADPEDTSSRLAPI